MVPAGDIESLRATHTQMEAMKLPANEEVVLGNVRGNAMELVAQIDPKGASMAEMDVLRSTSGEETTRILFFRERGLRDRSVSSARPSVVTIDMSRSSFCRTQPHGRPNRLQ